jgi:hypothetical protein
MHNGGIKYKKPPISWAHCGRWYVSSVEASGIAQSGGVALQAANWRLAWRAAPQPAYRASQKFCKFAELLFSPRANTFRRFSGKEQKTFARLELFGF